MASLHKDPQTGIFRIRFRYESRAYNRSLKTVNAKTANSVLGRTEENLRLIRQGRLEVPSKVDPAAFILSGGKINGQKKCQPITLGKLFETYQQRLPEAAKERLTVGLETTHIKNFKRILPTSKIANTVSTADLQRYAERRLKKKRNGRLISPETVKREMDTFRAIFNWAKNNDFVEGDPPTVGLTLGKPDAKPPFMTMAEITRRIERGGLSEAEEKELWECLYLTTDEITEFLKFVKKRDRYPFIYPMLYFVAFTGVRRSEMMRARIDDFDFETGTVLVREKKRSRTRATTYRRVDLAGSLVSVLNNWFDNHPGGQFAFCMPPVNGRSPSELTRDKARIQFSRTVRKSKWQNVRGYHVLRHSFASNLASKGADQRIIDEFMGHQTEAMRLRYRHLLPSVKRSAIQLLDL